MLGNELVTVRNGEVFTNSLIIANGTGNEHHSVTKNLRNYEADFLEFGEIGTNQKIEFMDLKSINSKRGRPTKIYQLNEQQATLLVTYLGNTKIVRDFKKELVKQFYQMRMLLQQGGALAPAGQYAALEARISKLEALQAPPPTPEEKHPSLVVSFFRAIQDAISDGGGWYIAQRKVPREYIEQPGKELLGTYDGMYLYLRSLSAYGIYKQVTRRPIEKNSLYALLVDSEYMEPTDRSSRKRVKSWSTQMVSMYGVRQFCMVLDRDKIRGLLVIPRMRSVRSFMAGY